MPMVCLKFIVERHPDGYLAYPLGMKGVVVGQGATFDAALADARSAAAFHLETFGDDVLAGQDEVIEAFVAEGSVNA